MQILSAHFPATDKLKEACGKDTPPDEMQVYALLALVEQMSYLTEVMSELKRVVEFQQMKRG